MKKVTVAHDKRYGIPERIRIQFITLSCGIKLNKGDFKEAEKLNKERETERRRDRNRQRQRDRETEKQGDREKKAHTDRTDRDRDRNTGRIANCSYILCFQIMMNALTLHV